ncbi:unnamed protein product [Penicillium glandicola]
MNYYLSLKTQEHPEDGLALLAKYMKVAPYLIPRSTNDEASSNVLMHPDLHLDNIFVDPETLQITRIVDWQSACVAPLFYHADVPRMCAHRVPLREGWAVPERPGGFDSLSAEEQRKIDDDIESEILHKYYEAQDLELHSKEEENINGVGGLMTLFRDQAVLPVDGMVEPKDYDTARENSRKFKEIFIGLAKDDEEKELFTKLWPYQEPVDTECL